MRLGADAVVLVLDRERRGHRLDDLFRGRQRLGEHETDRVKKRQACRLEGALPSEDGHLSNVSPEPVGVADLLQRSLERAREGFFDLRLLETDTQLSAEKLCEVP